MRGGCTRSATLATVAAAVIVIAAAWMAIAAAGSDRAGTAVVSGRLIDSSGSSVAGRVVAYPNILSGESGLVRALGSARTDDAGRFEIRSDDLTPLIAAASRNGGVANLTLLADSSTRTGAAFTSIRIPVDAARSAGEIEPAATRIELRPDPQAAKRGHHCPPAGTVRRRIVHVWRHKAAIVGELNNAYSDGTHAHWVYGRQADTVAGSGVRVEGGGWSAGGSTTIQNTESAAVGQHLDHKASWIMKTDFVVKEGKGVYCDQQHHRHVSHGVAATRWVGGLKHVPGNGLHRCSRKDAFVRNTDFSRDSKSAFTWRRGIRLPFISLSTRSGYSQWVHLHVAFGSRRHHYICGRHGRPPTSSKRIFSGAR